MNSITLVILHLVCWAVQDRFENEKNKNDTLIQQSNKTVKKYVAPNPIHLSGGVGGWGEPTHE